MGYVKRCLILNFKSYLSLNILMFNYTQFSQPIFCFFTWMNTPRGVVYHYIGPDLWTFFFFLGYLHRGRVWHDDETKVQIKRDDVKTILLQVKTASINNLLFEKVSNDIQKLIITIFRTPPKMFFSQWKRANIVLFLFLLFSSSARYFHSISFLCTSTLCIHYSYNKDRDVSLNTFRKNYFLICITIKSNDLTKWTSSKRVEPHTADLDKGKRFRTTNITQTVPNVSSHVPCMPKKLRIEYCTVHLNIQI